MESTTGSNLGCKVHLLLFLVYMSLQPLVDYEGIIVALTMALGMNQQSLLMYI